jgi:hypothetical protein
LIFSHKKAKKVKHMQKLNIKPKGNPGHKGPEGIRRQGEKEQLLSAAIRRILSHPEVRRQLSECRQPVSGESISAAEMLERRAILPEGSERLQLYEAVEAILGDGMLRIALIGYPSSANPNLNALSILRSAQGNPNYWVMGEPVKSHTLTSPVGRLSDSEVRGWEKAEGHL